MIFNLCLIAIVLVLYVMFISNKFFSKNNKEKYFLLVIFLLFFIIVGMREITVGNDTPAYISLFKSCGILKWKSVSFDGYYEGGYLILNVLLSFISNKSRFFLIVMSLIFNFIIYNFIKNNSKNYLLSIIMYICLLFFYNSMTMMRQFCAIVIVLSSFKFVKEKNILLFTISIILASLFHSSVWIALLIYPIYNMKHSFRTVIVIVIIAIFSMFFLEPIIDFICNVIGRANYYTDRIGSNNIANLLYTLVYFVMYIFSLNVLKKQNNIESIPNKDFYLNILLLSTLINFIAINMNILARASLYFEIFTIIIFPNILNFIKNDFSKKIMYITTVFFLLIYSTTIIVFRPEWNSAFNYKSCIIKNEGDICN